MTTLTFGFDPGTKFGWAVFNNTNLVDSGVWINKTGKSIHPGLRFEKSRAALLALMHSHIQKAQPTEIIIGYEDVHVSVFRDKNNLRVYTGLVASIFQAAALNNINDIRGVTPTSLKKHSTDNGKATKPAMVDACIKKFNIFPDTDDHADAIWVGHYFAHKELECQNSTKKNSTSTSQTTTPVTRSTTKSDKLGEGSSKKTGKSSKSGKEIRLPPKKKSKKLPKPGKSIKS